MSAISGEGLPALRSAIAAALGAEDLRDTPALTNLRHARLLERALEMLDRARSAAATATPEEFVLADLHEARVLLEEVTGRRTADDTLHERLDLRHRAVVRQVADVERAVRRRRPTTTDGTATGNTKSASSSRLPRRPSRAAASAAQPPASSARRLAVTAVTRLVVSAASASPLVAAV